VQGTSARPDPADVDDGAKLTTCRLTCAVDWRKFETDWGREQRLEAIAKAEATPSTYARTLRSTWARVRHEGAGLTPTAIAKPSASAGERAIDVRHGAELIQSIFECSTRSARRRANCLGACLALCVGARVRDGGSR
jgi:hypothetical protein